MEIKLPDTGTLHDDPLFTDLGDAYVGGRQGGFGVAEGAFSGARTYLEGRVSLPTFSAGAADEPMIDAYAAAFIKVLSQADQVPA